MSMNDHERPVTKTPEILRFWDYLKFIDTKVM